MSEAFKRRKNERFLHISYNTYKKNFLTIIFLCPETADPIKLSHKFALVGPLHVPTFTMFFV